MRVLPWTLAGLLSLAPTVVFAGQCEDSFSKAGNMITGQRFSARVTVPDLSPASAIQQLRGIVVAKQYQVITDDPESGAMLFEQAMQNGARGFPLTASAVSDGKSGTVTIEAKLKRGMSAQDNEAKTQLCSLLAQLKGGKAGAQAAAKGKSATNKAQPALKMSVLAFSNTILNDWDKNKAAVVPRYKGRSFIIHGRVDSVYPNSDGSYSVYYEKIDPMSLPIVLPGQQRDHVQVICRVPKSQSTFALTLKTNARITLQGVFDDFNYPRIWLTDCKPSQ